MTKSPICKVLVVEDDHYVAELLRDVFLGEGYRFVLATTHAEAQRAIDEEPSIDAAVVDLTLRGGGDGLAFACALAERGCAVIVVTGDHSRFEEITRSGHRHLLKPFRMASLLEIVDMVLMETKRDCERPGGVAVEAVEGA